MNSPLVTNILLMLIAVLLLVGIIQNSGGTKNSSYSYHSTPVPSSATNPTLKPGVSEMGHSMFFQALSAFPEGCESLSTLAECDSPAAQLVKSEILEVAEGRGPREVFDFVIEKYGMNALTPQAQKIRQMRTGQ